MLYDKHVVSRHYDKKHKTHCICDVEATVGTKRRDRVVRSGVGTDLVAEFLITSVSAIIITITHVERRNAAFVLTFEVHYSTLRVICREQHLDRLMVTIS